MWLQNRQLSTIFACDVINECPLFNVIKPQYISNTGHIIFIKSYSSLRLDISLFISMQNMIYKKEIDAHTSLT